MPHTNDSRPLSSLRTRLSRRDLLSFAAKGPASVVVTQFHANNPHTTRDQRNTVNTTDGIYNSLSATQKAALTLQPAQSGDGYAGTINPGVQVG